ncbi:aminotransferase [Agrobacterium vitis]|uniref:pyridoxal phosphate-dependent aminotransferase n=1 Tax=Agrobacterium vitis TaxID=373 RepID=UPI0015D84340|nr:pyridoxal phosphate-dependent aminotransferase [Agrobacterium vitis]BCH59221.1 aminotransferase [Agrobacterium vitis]
MKEALDLSIGELRTTIPQPIQDKVLGCLLGRPMNYLPPGGMPELREAIASTAVLGQPISPSQISITGGASMALTVALLSAGGAGDLIALPQICFPGTRNTVQFLGMRTVLYSGWDDLGALFSRERPRFVLVNSPSNPAGHVIKPDQLLYVEELCRSYNATLLYDEVYRDFVYEGHNPEPSHDVDCFRICSFSKMLGITGWRIGYLISPTAMSSRVDRVHYALAMSASTPAQVLALAYHEWSEMHSWKRQLVQRCKDDRDATVAALKRADLQINPPAGAYFLWFDMGKVGVKSADFVKLVSIRHNMLIADGQPFDASQRDALRFRVNFAMTSGRAPEVADALRDSLDIVLEALKKNARLKGAEHKWQRSRPDP